MADLSKLRIGSTGSASALVTEQRLAPAVGSGEAPVFASPMLVALMEAAAVDCVEAQLPQDHQSLGVHLDVTHSAPTPLGLTVTATATLASVDGRKLVFDVAATDGIDQIGSGRHTRVVVDTARFLARLAAKSLPRS
ncbi:thioesterase family protein [Hyphomicrobium sp.]|jgi:predicted thioesterase|uniref:thioesterase family protein n=1 Tax=Hyphomicrobium sp. TaxID=82 RepID=UPI002CAB940E|nr:thioesterase family protein [Hyphomicrobium sp.]HVZ04491.1 thioesterase family protein [Hyphomicrobium sp.]